jgi:hypothetical protein
MPEPIAEEVTMTERQDAWLQGFHDLYVFFFERPDLIPDYTGLMLNSFPDDKDEFVRLAKLLGSAKKETTGGHYSHSRRFGPHEVLVNIQREEICERVQVGTKSVTEWVAPEDTELVEVTTEQPVYEWKCPESILS